VQRPSGVPSTMGTSTSWPGPEPKSQYCHGRTLVAPSPLEQLPVNLESELTGAFTPAPVAALPAHTCQGSTLITRPEPCAAALVQERVNVDGEDTGTLATTPPVATLPPQTCHGAMLITVRSLSLEALTQLPVNFVGDAAATSATAGPVAELPAQGCQGS